MPATETGTDVRWIAVARLLRPQGRRGEILAEPLTDLAEVFSADRTLHLSTGPDAQKPGDPVVLESSWRPQGRNAGRLVIKLAGVDSISAAEALAQRELLLMESELPPLEAGTFLVRDLLGCELFDGTQPVGTVADLQFPVGADGRTRLPDAVDLLVVEPVSDLPDPEPVLVPFVKAWLESVDLEAKRITMQLPPGLFDPSLDPETEGPSVSL